MYYIPTKFRFLQKGISYVTTIIRTWKQGQFVKFVLISFGLKFGQSIIFCINT